MVNTPELLKKGKERVALRIYSAQEPGSSYYIIYADVVYVDEGRGPNDYLGFYSNCVSELHQYKGLQVVAHVDRFSLTPYAWELCIRGIGDAVSLSQAEVMVKTLRPIHRKLNALAAKENYVHSFEELVLRVARVLNVQAFFVRQDEKHRFVLMEDVSQLEIQLNKLVKTTLISLGHQQVA